MGVGVWGALVDNTFFCLFLHIHKCLAFITVVVVLLCSLVFDELSFESAVKFTSLGGKPGEAELEAELELDGRMESSFVSRKERKIGTATGRASGAFETRKTEEENLKRVGWFQAFKRHAQ